VPGPGRGREVGRSNAHHLAAAIAARAGGGQAIDVDLSELAFIDLGGVRAIGEAAAAVPVRLRVTGMPPAGRRIVDLLGDGLANVDLTPG
jgi:anti-anti-sigma regulatory factor